MPNSSTTQAELLYLGGIQDMNRSCISAIAFLLYDVGLKLFEEIRLIWRLRWSAPKVLYLVCRYYPLLFLFIQLASVRSPVLPVITKIKPHIKNNRSCRFSFWFGQLGGILPVSVATHIIFAIRTSALYGHNTSVIWLLVILETSFFGLQLASGILQAITLEETGVLLPNISLCWSDIDKPRLHRLQLISGIPTVCSGALFFALTARKFFQYTNIRDYVRLSRSSRLMVTYARDGVMFPLIMFVVLLIYCLTAFRG
ncbi:hypothetical protein BDQ17DRAFT_1409505, partial [Cyathus striatus]